MKLAAVKQGDTYTLYLGEDLSRVAGFLKEVSLSDEVKVIDIILFDWITE